VTRVDQLVADAERAGHLEGEGTAADLAQHHRVARRSRRAVPPARRRARSRLPAPGRRAHRDLGEVEHLRVAVDVDADQLGEALAAVTPSAALARRAISACPERNGATAATSGCSAMVASRAGRQAASRRSSTAAGSRAAWPQRRAHELVDEAVGERQRRDQHHHADRDAEDGDQALQARRRTCRAPGRRRSGARVSLARAQARSRIVAECADPGMAGRGRSGQRDASQRVDAEAVRAGETPSSSGPSRP
jgi:hypothetical protein